MRSCFLAGLLLLLVTATVSIEQQSFETEDSADEGASLGLIEDLNLEEGLDADEEEDEEDDDEDDDEDESETDIPDDLNLDDLDVDATDEEDGLSKVVSFIEDARHCHIPRHRRCAHFKREHQRCRRCRSVSRCKCRAIRAVSRLLTLRGKWKIVKLEQKIKDLASSFKEMSGKIHDLTESDFMPEKLEQSFENFTWKPDVAPPGPAPEPEDTRPVATQKWQEQWIRWGWARSPDDLITKKKPEEQKVPTEPKIVKHSCPGREIARKDSLSKGTTASIHKKELGGNFFNDEDWSICFRARLDCLVGESSKWQVVFGGQCGQPIIGYMAGHWVFARQCGGAPSIAFGKGNCDRASDISVIKKGRKLCFVIDGLQTKCKKFSSKFKAYAPHTHYTIGAGFHDGREPFAGHIHWLRVGSGSSGEDAPNVEKNKGGCPAMKKAAELEKKDFVADSNLEFESVAGRNCKNRNAKCKEGVPVAKHYSYAAAFFNQNTTNLFTKWSSSPNFSGTNNDGESGFGSSPITIHFSKTKHYTRVGFVVLGLGGSVHIDLYDDNGCKTGERKFKYSEGRHPAENFVGLGGVGVLGKVVISGSKFAIDDVQFGSDDDQNVKPVKMLELEQFTGDRVITFDDVAGPNCVTKSENCPDGNSVGNFYSSQGIVLGEGTKNIYTQFATSGGFAVSNGPVSGWSNRPIIVYFFKPVNRVGFSVLGVGDAIDIQAFDSQDNLIGATQAAYSQGQGQFVGIGGIGDISRIAIIGRGFGIDDLRYSSEPSTPPTTTEVVNAIGDVKAWYKSDKGVVLSDHQVSSWEDQSGNGYHLSQTVPDKFPRLVESGLNGKPVINFDGVDDLLSNTSFSSCTHKTTIFAVFQLNTFEAKMGYPWALGDHDPGFMTQQSEGSTTSFDIAFGYGNDRKFSIPDADGYRLLTYSGDSKQDIKVWANGNPADMTPFACCSGPAAFNTPALPCFNRISLGGLDLAVNHSEKNTKVSWAEFIVYEKELTRLEREQVELYLTKKYALKTGDSGVTTCASIKLKHPDAKDGFFDLHMQDGSVTKAYCDMTTDGGGWTRIEVIDKAITAAGTLGSAQFVSDVVGASDKIFRFTDKPNGSGQHNLYIKDDSPAIGERPLAWTSTAARVGCKVEFDGPWAWTTDHNVSCDKQIIGDHTCGEPSGWVLYHNGNTYNQDGKHPCATAPDQAQPFLRYLWVK